MTGDLESYITARDEGEMGFDTLVEEKLPPGKKRVRRNNQPHLVQEVSQ